LHGLAASYTRIEEYYRGKAMAEMDLPDIDLEGRVVIMTGRRLPGGRLDPWDHKNQAGAQQV